MDQENYTSIRTLIKDVNKKLEKDLNFKGSPNSNKLKGNRKSVDKYRGASTSVRKNLGKFDVIKGNKIRIKLNQNNFRKI